MSKFGADYNPKGIGERSESQVLALFLKHGKVVLTPFGDNQRYDLVVDEQGTFIRVQCKTGCMNEDQQAFTFPTCSTNWNQGTLRGYNGQADVFAVYVPNTDEVYIVPVEGSPTKSCTLRLGRSSRDSKKSKNARVYLFDPSKSLMQYPRVGSSMAELSTFNRKDEGSTPSQPTS